MAADVFLSYASDTRPLAEELARALENHGIESWADFKDLAPGQKWEDELDRAIARANSYLIVVGPESRAGRWQDAEWRAALTSAWRNDKKLIPVIVGEGAMPPFLQSWVGVRVDPKAEPGTWTRHVLTALAAPARKAEISGEERRQWKQLLEEVRVAAEGLGEQEGERLPGNEG